MPNINELSEITSQYIFSFSCPDRIGLLAQVSSILYEHNAFITEIAHYGDPQTNKFFSRMVFDDRAMSISHNQFIAVVDSLAGTLDMSCRLRSVTDKPRVLIAVSRYDHCLNVLLTKWRAGALPVEVVGVFSNHEHCRSLVKWFGVPYEHLPITPDSKPEQERHVLRLMDELQVDLLVLARYMQVLSDEMCAQLAGRAINIHHSFLPGFKGAKPYHQAYQRGVKVIGATAHYVTADLDEGPIIVQEVKPIDHSVTVEQMINLGHDIEATALAQAVRLHCEDRVILNGERTVIL